MLVIGVGNRSRGDDGAGPRAASRLRARLEEEAGRVRDRRGGPVATSGKDLRSRRDDPGPGVSRDHRVLERGGDVASLLEDWAGEESVTVIDAMSCGAPPGTVRRFDVGGRPLPAGFARSSTHALGVVEAVELGRALGRLPRRLIVYGIEGRNFEPGEGLTPEVERAVDSVVERIEREITTRRTPAARP